jgi:hypothetical protein
MKKLLFTVFAAALILSGCDKSKTDSLVNNGPGRLIVSITDDPFNIDLVESATVTISKIEVRKTGDETGNPFIVVSENPVNVELIDLRNGITKELADIAIPAGDYDLVRLYIGEASLTIKGNEVPLKVPSGQQTGIKLFIDPVLHVEGGLTEELLLDFDLANSFVMRGNMQHAAGVNGFIFKPVIRAVNQSTAGRIEGKIRDDAAEPVVVPDAEVWVTQQDATIATTFSDLDGNYTLAGLPAGTYSIYASKDGYDPSNPEEVTVVAANKTVHDITLIGPPKYVSSVIENDAPDKLVITFSKVLADVTPDVGAFAVLVTKDEVESEKTVNEVTVDGQTVTLLLDSSDPQIINGVTVTVAYAKPETNPLQTETGLEVPSFDAQTVDNQVEK